MKKVLIIDDEADLRFFVKMNLELRGNYEVIAAAEGEEGILIAEKERPGLILLDIIMPKIDGFEVLRRLKKNEKTRSIPVIMLTARSDDEARIKALNLHNDSYIVKPFGIAELEEKIQDTIYKNEKEG